MGDPTGKREGKRFLITGGSGQLGRRLRAAWAVQPPEGLALLWQSRRGGDGAIGWDMLSDPWPAGAPAPDVVLNLAGVTPGSAGPGALADNAALALAACRMAAATGARHVFLVSSAAVYGPTAAPAREAGPTAPGGAYGVAKLEMERRALDWRRATGAGAPGITCLRIGNIAGADALLAPDRTALTLDDFPGQPGAGPLRSYIGLVTLSRVLASLARAALAGATLPEILNIAAPRAVAMADLARAAGREVTLRPAPPQALARVVLDTSRLTALVPFAPEESEPAQMVAEMRQCGGRGA